MDEAAWFSANWVAVGVSVVSLLIAVFALGWNVYRDVVLKPRLKVTVAISQIADTLGTEHPTYVSVSGTNFGPGPINVVMVHGECGAWWKRLLRHTRKFVVIHDYRNPISGQLPTKLEVGNKVDLLFEFTAGCFLKEPVFRVGLRDSFGRLHWASRKLTRNARNAYRGKFGDALA